MNEAQVDFSTYCIGILSEALEMDEATVYRKLHSSDILTNYIVKCYEALHTFGRQYLVEDLTGLMRKRGVL